jgi:hypothetical protein
MEVSNSDLVLYIDAYYSSVGWTPPGLFSVLCLTEPIKAQQLYYNFEFRMPATFLLIYKTQMRSYLRALLSFSNSFEYLTPPIKRKIDAEISSSIFSTSPLATGEQPEFIIPQPPPPYRSTIYETDFLSFQTTQNPFAGTAVFSGGAAARFYEKHPGVLAFRDSSTANGGYRFQTTISMSFSGGEKMRAILLFPAVSGFRNTIVMRLGYMNSTSVFEAASGSYFRFNGVNITGIARRNNAQSVTTTFTPTADIWYNFYITVNSTATNILFEIKNEDADQLLWSDNVTSNIPGFNGPSATFGLGIEAYQTTNDAAGDMVHIDYLGFSFAENKYF